MHASEATCISQSTDLPPMLVDYDASLSSTLSFREWGGWQPSTRPSPVPRVLVHLMPDAGVGQHTRRTNR